MFVQAGSDAAQRAILEWVDFTPTVEPVEVASAVEDAKKTDKKSDKKK